MDALTTRGISGGVRYQSGNDRCVGLSTANGEYHWMTLGAYVARIVACSHEQTSKGFFGLQWCDECSTAFVWQRPAVSS
jgi:hypothetical protein